MALSLRAEEVHRRRSAAVAAKAHSAVAAEYRGLSVWRDCTAFRRSRKTGVYVRVVKNTLARAPSKAPSSNACRRIGRPADTGVLQEDPGAAARLMPDFAKANDKMVMKLVRSAARYLAAGDIDRLSNMPTRDQALSMLMGVMQAPITKFVSYLVRPNAKMVRTFAALRDKKQAAVTQ